MQRNDTNETVQQDIGNMQNIAHEPLPGRRQLWSPPCNSQEGWYQNMRRQFGHYLNLTHRQIHGENNWEHNEAARLRGMPGVQGGKTVRLRIQ